jgi:hypothetical protein
MLSRLNLPQTTNIENLILSIRNQKVMLDFDLAKLYRVETKYLNRQINRNKERFPEEFMFQLTKEEKNEVVTNCHHLESLKFSHSLPYAFNEHGIAMLATVLKGNIAVKISIHIIKAFVKLRGLAATYTELSRKLDHLENKVQKHDKDIQMIFNSIRQMIIFKESPKRKIGFSHEEE